MNAYGIALFTHVLVVVYLLGADLGRLYLVGVGATTGASADARLTAARGVAWLGSVTNAALVLILPVGISLAGTLGAYRIVSASWLVATWIVAATWLVVSIAADRAATRPGGGRGLEGADTIARFVIGAGHLYDGAIAFSGTSRTVDAGWLAAKISLFGLLILISIPVRRAGFKARRAAAALEAAPTDAEAADRLATALARMRTPIIAGWLLILIAAWLGAAKPI